ncbi:MAG TPA: GTP-binding protein [Burkholderiaceae bacterium]|nr:GTP-binding protein [Burkholderiaceae bacterium]
MTLCSVQGQGVPDPTAIFGAYQGPDDSRLSLSMVGGFLGSGKTTLLSQVLAHEPDTQILVNDLGETAPELVLQAGHVHTLLGGCACCEKRNELATLLRDICSARHAQISDVSRLVLEMSGLADPANILSAIDADPVLTANVRIDDVVVTLDAVRGVGDLIHEPLARQQIQQCDRVIITKADLATDEQLDTMVATVASLNAGAERRVTTFGELQDVPPVRPDRAVDLAAASDHADSQPTLTAWIPFSATLDWSAFALWLGSLVYAHQHDILRVKGLLRTARGLVVVHAARGVIGVPTVSADQQVDPEQLGLLFIMRNISRAQLLKSWQHYIADPEQNE